MIDDYYPSQLFSRENMRNTKHLIKYNQKCSYTPYTHTNKQNTLITRIKDKIGHAPHDMFVDTYGRLGGRIPGLKEVGTPEDDQQNQITWTLRALRD